MSYIGYGDTEFIEALAKSDRNFVQRIFDAVKDFFEKALKRYTKEKETNLSSEIQTAVDMLKDEQDRVIKAFENILHKTEIMQGRRIKKAENSDITVSEKTQKTLEAVGVKKVLNSSKDNVITREDVKIIQGIGRKSINELTKEELKILEPIANKYFAEMGVKSPFFRRWFGDWRAHDKKTKVKTVLVETISLDNAILENGDYTIADTNWVVHAGTTLSEETNHYARGKKISVRALNSIENILNNAILFDTEVSVKDSTKKSQNTMLMHKFYTPIIYGGKMYIAKTSVEEFLDEGTDSIKRKAYHLHAIKIELADGDSEAKTSTVPRSDTNSIDNISNLFQLVKTYDKDFKPVPSSVAVDKNGVPQKMYRGDAENFTVFDRKKSKYSNLYGRGFYFTESESHAKQYGNARVFYLNIKNPVSTDKTTITKEQLRKFVEEIAENEDYGLENYGYGATVDSVVESVYGKTDFLMLYDINQTAIGDMVEAVELFNKVNNTSYDGLILETETVVFDPNQIKSVDNQGTFSSWDNDIMKSKPETDAKTTSTEVAKASISIPPVLNLDAEVQAKLNELVEKYGKINKSPDVNIPKAVPQGVHAFRPSTSTAHLRAV